MPNDSSIVAWMVRGLGGIINMLAQYADEDGRVTPHYRQELAGLVKRLTDTIARLKDF